MNKKKQLKTRNVTDNNLIVKDTRTFSSRLVLIYLYIFIFFNANNLHAISSLLNNTVEIISPGIKTVQFHRLGWPLSYPILNLNSDQKLLLTFDEPGNQVKNYYYTITLCDANWRESGLMTTDYLRGIAINPLLDYSFSFNTTFDYLHYRLEIPNQNILPTRSGNYFLKIFEINKEDNPVLVKKFMVVEPNVKIKSVIRNTASSSLRASYHEIDFEIHHPGFTIRNPLNEVSVTIIQNGRSDNAITGLKPVFFRDGLMDFNYNRENLMEGGNEFRYIDLRSTRFLSDRVKEINFIDPFFHVTVFTDYTRNKFSYQYRKDLNGRFFIEVQEHTNPDLEADYVFVHFLLKPENPSPFQKIYLNGSLTNWQISNNSEMVFNQISNSYELSLLLKQGYYNYQYLLLEKGATSLSPIEGNFEQTENDYLILVYYKGIGDQNHRLIGAEILNSLIPQALQHERYGLRE